MSARLYIGACASVSLGQALDALAGLQPEGAVALVYAPGFCKLGRLTREGRLAGPPDLPDLDARAKAEAFEARIFCDGWELRWLKQRDGGRAALLSDDDIHAEGFEAANPYGGGVEPAGSLEQRYLLWGKVASGDGEWTELTAARIGRLWAPLPKPATERVQLHAREYLARCEHGNVVVAHERLRSLAPADGPAPTATKTKEKADG